MFKMSCRYVPEFLGRKDDWRYRLVGLMAVSQTGEVSSND